MRILLIEDDSATASSIEVMLVSEGFSVFVTASGKKGLELARIYEYDLILLDLNLPDISGYQVLKALRAAKVRTAIIIISGLAGIEDQVKGLGYGADAYITKPFFKDLLIANMHAVTRRVRGYAHSIIEVGELSLDIVKKEVKVDGVLLRITAKEYDFLHTLFLRAGTVVSKKSLLASVYGTHPPEEKTVDVFIFKIRKKIAEIIKDKEYIETIWGQGYKLRDPAVEPTLRR